MTLVHCIGACTTRITRGARIGGRPIAIIAAACLLAGCSGGSQPFGKLEGSNAPTGEILPPSEAFRPAGPGAEEDLDYETVYGPGALPPESTVVLAEPTESRSPPDETSAARPARPPKGGTATASGPEIRAVAVVAVKGAPGKGNDELTDAMRRTLRAAGWPVINSPREDALTVAGTVALARPKGAAQTVTLNWTVTTYSGSVLGTIKQANDVPAGSLDVSWGEAARYATEAGATGVFDLVKRYR